MELTRKAMTELKTAPDGREKLFQAVCKDITDNVKSTRASIWTFDDDKKSIYCESLYDTREGVFSAGAVLSKDDFPAYFDAIERDAFLVAPHAELHSATRAFNEAYFEPNDICSLLDYVISVGGEAVGVLCCEHCGDIKNWTEEDQHYLLQMAAMLAFSMRMLARKG